MLARSVPSRSFRAAATPWTTPPRCSTSMRTAPSPPCSPRPSTPRSSPPTSLRCSHAGSDREPPLMQTLNILLQFILPHHAISRFMLWFTRIRFRPVKNLFTGFFLKVYKPDLSEAVLPDPYAYEHFNALFTRALRADARPLAGDARTLVSPVDGTMNLCGPIEANLLLQAK